MLFHFNVLRDPHRILLRFLLETHNVDIIGDDLVRTPRKSWVSTFTWATRKVICKSSGRMTTSNPVHLDAFLPRRPLQSVCHWIQPEHHATERCLDSPIKVATKWVGSVFIIDIYWRTRLSHPPSLWQRSSHSWRRFSGRVTKTSTSALLQFRNSYRMSVRFPQPAVLKGPPCSLIIARAIATCHADHPIVFGSTFFKSSANWPFSHFWKPDVSAFVQPNEGEKSLYFKDRHMRKQGRTERRCGHPAC